MYAYAWKSGLKTTYYLRSRPATRINQTGTGTGGAAAASAGSGPAGGAGAAGEVGGAAVAAPAFSDAEAVACSLENPETCEACD